MSSVFPTYGRLDVVVDHAEGTQVTDVNGKDYLDFTAGIGVVNLGHGHSSVKKAVASQLDKIWHISNLYHIPLQEEVAERLAQNSSGDRVFFCNSGAEANEAAIKLARKATGKSQIITCEQSFHGRTFATMSATGQEKIHSGFGPLLESFIHVPFNDADAVMKAINEDTAAIMLEVIQGEGGVIPAAKSFMTKVAAAAKEQGILLIIDEIQTGIGRTGKPFAYQHYQVIPDIITVAKALGNGLPVGAMVAKDYLTEHFGTGSHGSTFGGNPLVMAAANQVLHEVFDPVFLQDTIARGAYLQQCLEEKLGSRDIVLGIRGKGLMIGIECKYPVQPIVQTAITKGLLVLQAGANVLRLLPPLIVTEMEIDDAAEILHQCIKEYEMALSC